MTEPHRVRAATLSDVAQLAGVSYQTVSRVVNHHPHVAAPTRDRVQRAIEATGYRPNPSARALATGAGPAVAVVSQQHAREVDADLLSALRRAAGEAGYELRVVDHHPAPAPGTCPGPDCGGRTPGVLLALSRGSRRG